MRTQLYKLPQGDRQRFQPLDLSMLLLTVYEQWRIQCSAVNTCRIYGSSIPSGDDACFLGSLFFANVFAFHH